MKKMKKILLLLTALLLIVSMCSCGGAKAPYVGENGNWYVDGKDTGVSAKGESGETGDVGDPGKELTVISNEKISDDGSVAKYKIVFSNGFEKVLEVKSGVSVDFASCELVSSTDEKNVYKFKFSDSNEEYTFEIKNGSDGADGDYVLNDIDKPNYEIIKSDAIGGGVITLTADSLASGEILRPMKGDAPVINAALGSKVLNVTLKVKDLAGSVIKIGHGMTPGVDIGGNYIEISEKELKIYEVGETLNCLSTTKHRLNIAEYLTVSIDTTGAGRAKISIKTTDKDDIFVKSTPWSGNNGSLFVSPVETSVTDVKLSWFCDDYSADTYIVGDFGIGYTDASWTNYLAEYGNTNNCVIGYNGMGSDAGLAEFKASLEFGTPKFALWAVGSEEGDDGAINASWLANTEEFLDICKAKGIIPVLATLPSTLTVSHEDKNEWIRANYFVDEEDIMVAVNSATAFLRLTSCIKEGEGATLSEYKASFKFGSYTYDHSFTLSNDTPYFNVSDLIFNYSETDYFGDLNYYYTVKVSSYRIVDFEKAAGADVYDDALIGTFTEKADGTTVENTTGYAWHEGMYDIDTGSMTDIGAQAFYMRARIDLQEIILK